MKKQIVRESQSGFVAEEKLWLTADGKIVRDGDYRAATLLAMKGAVISEKVAKRLGLENVEVEPLETAPARPGGFLMRPPRAGIV